MTPLHDEVFFEIDSARKLAAEFKTRRLSANDVPARDMAADAPAAAEPADEVVVHEELSADEKDAFALAKERAERRDKARADEKAVASETWLRKSSENARAKMEAAELVEELEKARADERAAAEESLRKAAEAEDAGNAAEQPPAPDHVRYSWFPALGASQVWYFTSEGERRGPVTFADLRKMADGSVLNPRFDMVWKKGMDDWKPAGQIDGLFERISFQNAPAPVVVKPAEPVASLRSEVLVKALASKNLIWPGSGRWSLWLGALVFPIVWKRGLTLAAPYAAPHVGAENLAFAMPWLHLVPWLLLVVLVFRRFANLGMNRWWMAALAVPVLNLWVGFRCLVCPPGYAYHKKLDAPGVALLIGIGLLVPALALGLLKLPPQMGIGRLWSMVDGAGSVTSGS